jgi:hypothetical protein
MPNSLTREKARHLAFKTLDDLEWLEKHVTFRQAKDLKMIEFKLRDIKKRMLKIIDTYVHEEMMSDDLDKDEAISVQAVPQTGSGEELDIPAPTSDQSSLTESKYGAGDLFLYPEQISEQLDLHHDELVATSLEGALTQPLLLTQPDLPD